MKITNPTKKKVYKRRRERNRNAKKNRRSVQIDGLRPTKRETTQQSREFRGRGEGKKGEMQMRKEVECREVTHCKERTNCIVR